MDLRIVESRQGKPGRPGDAFTLLELLIVMGIIVIVLGFTIPVVTGLSKSNNLNSGARLVANLLTIARSEAINRRALIRFEVATTWPQLITHPPTEK